MTFTAETFGQTKFIVKQVVKKDRDVTMNCIKTPVPNHFSSSSEDILI